MLTAISQAEQMVQVAVAVGPAPPAGGWTEYEDWAQEAAYLEWVACLSAYALLPASLRDEWAARVKLDLGDDLPPYPCQGCGSLCGLHQPGCAEMDPAYLAWQREEAGQCHASVTYGPREDPYGATCHKPAGHHLAVTADGLPDYPARLHEGLDALGGGLARWESGGGLIEGDPVPVEGLRLVLPAELANPHPECGHDDPNEHPACDHCWWAQTHDVDPLTGEVTDLLTQGS
jgi:hypothetical protein